MNLTILAVGQIKEHYYKDAIAEYAKRLQRYCNLRIIEVADEKTKEDASEAELAMIRDKEAKRLLAHIRPQDYCITLEIKGKSLDSVGLAHHLDQLATSARSDLVFVIGGSVGLGEEVLARSDFALSFSAMTFPHQLMRVILLEQIYRSYRINRGEPYHK